MLQQELNYERVQTICLAVLSVVAVTFSIYWLRPVLVPLVVALFVVSGVSPVLTTLEHGLGVNRLMAAGLTFLAGVVALIIFGFSIFVSIADLSSNGDAYRHRVREIVNKAEQTAAMILPMPKGGKQARQRPSDLLSRDVDSNPSGETPQPESVSPATPNSNRQPDTDRVEPNAVENRAPQVGTDLANQQDPGDLADHPGHRESAAAGDGRSSEPLEPIQLENPDDPSDFVDTFVREGISNLSQAFVSLVSTSVVVLIYVFFLLIGTPNVKYDSPTIREIDAQIRSYLAVKTIISIFTGLAFGFALRLFGVPMAFTFGVMAFLLNFVPNIGPLVASLLPVPLIILDPTGSVAWMVAAISVTCAIQAISGNIVEPKVMGNSSDLHPVTILVALMFWGMMWGIIGMFLATPITAAIKIVLQRIESTRPIANLMAGRIGELSSKRQVV